ncbi:NADH dehydrogenase [ubiquinone] 1 alpha subcomplex assembly factor 2-like [Mytilus galloprovincialis]|uniref:NADH dehydrogenase [ubiquinone] 1 alpha subcomplex assembly factor 2-like n=1 Tax=Mytilus galloprovincialis TaxID=29158 RepID=UPI003F7C0F1E
MSKSTGITARIFNLVRQSWRKNPTQVTSSKGEDHLGNKYFELPADKAKLGRGRRWVEAKQKVGADDTLSDIPTEWTSWLRFTRKEPPTQEEIDRNYVLMMRTQHRAKEIEMKDQLQKESENPEGDGVTKSIQGKSNKFPVYEEYDTQPGRMKR